MILRLKTIGNDMGAKRNKLDPFELRTDLPRDIIDAEFKAAGTVKKEQHSHRMKPFIDALLYHLDNYSNIAIYNQTF